MENTINVIPREDADQWEEIYKYFLGEATNKDQPQRNINRAMCFMVEALYELCQLKGYYLVKK